MSSGRLTDRENPSLVSFHRARLVTILALVGLIFGLLSAALRTPSYESLARVAVLNPEGSLAEEALVLESPAVLSLAEQNLGFRPQVSVEQIAGQNLLTLNAVASSSSDAARAATAVVSAYRDLQVASAVQVVQFGEAPDAPFAPNRTVYMLFGTALGAIVGLGASQLLRLLGAQPARRDDGDLLDEHDDEFTVDLTADDEGVVILGTEPPSPDSDVRDRVLPTPAPALVPAPVGRAQPGSDASSSSSHPEVKSPRANDAETEAPLHSGWLAASTATEPATSASALHPQPAVVPLPTKRRASDLADHGKPTDDAAEPASAKRALSRRRATAARPRAGDEGKPADAREVQPERSGLPADTRSTPGDHVRGTPVSQALTAENTSVVDAAIVTGAALSEPATGDDAPELTGEAMVAMRIDHDREVLAYKAEIAKLNKELRNKTLAIRELTSTDQSRVGDLESQVDLLERELDKQRTLAESDRIAQSRLLADERTRSDRALDTARKRFQSELAKSETQHRAELVKARTELDGTLERYRREHAAELEEQHAAYEQALVKERDRQAKFVDAARSRFERELGERSDAERTELAALNTQQREVLADLRSRYNDADNEATELRRSTRRLQREADRAKARLNDVDERHRKAIAEVHEQVLMLKTQLRDEQARNKALRRDVERRTEQANKRVADALAKRSNQLSQLEASLEQQRKYSEQRVRDVSAAADERARSAAAREAELLAVISRLERGEAAPDDDAEAL